MSEEPSHRREFFRDALAGIVRPLAAYLEDKIDLGEVRPFLRPPGAVEEREFLDTCYRCGACVETCPVDAIKLRQAPGRPWNGTPGIDADVAACVVCDGIKCTLGCPSGALQPINYTKDIRMGLALVAAEHCVRSQGESCTLCVDKCPIGPAAIHFADDGPPRVTPAGCVGCGVCQLYCPTLPKAIVVQPV